MVLDFISLYYYQLHGIYTESNYYYNSEAGWCTAILSLFSEYVQVIR